MLAMVFLSPIETAQTTSWTSDEVNELEQESQGLSETRSYIYDPNGALIEVTSEPSGDPEKVYTWDRGRRLSSYSDSGVSCSFTYDGLGRLVKAVHTPTGDSPIERYYLWCGLVICEERSNAGATVTKRFFDEGYVDVTNHVTFHYTKDHLGSVRELVDATGAVVSRFTYDPWGRHTQVSGTVNSPVGYAGYFRHAASGLDLTLFRAYDPEQGRWLSRDPIFEEGGLNVYGYVGNSPGNGVDVWGLKFYIPGSQAWRFRRQASTPVRPRYYMTREVQVHSGGALQIQSQP